jgi:NADH-quinone oxidoreductase subunit N
MLGLAGLPLTSGFVSKFILITNLWSYERYILVTVLMLTTVVGFYFYLRPIWVAAVEKTENIVEKIQVKNSDKLLLSVLAALTIYFGLLPDTLVNITRWMVEGYL